VPAAVLEASVDRSINVVWYGIAFCGRNSIENEHADKPATLHRFVPRTRKPPSVEVATAAVVSCGFVDGIPETVMLQVFDLFTSTGPKLWLMSER
jgi:hypothetical protein